jgi:uncharacterized protein DUF6881
MNYIRVAWHHSFPDEPIVLYSEMNEERWEVRKVDIFRDGPPGIASATLSTRDAMLGEKPIPPTSEIASDPQLKPSEITKEEFEEVWSRAIQLLSQGSTWS